MISFAATNVHIRKPKVKALEALNAGMFLHVYSFQPTATRGLSLSVNPQFYSRDQDLSLSQLTVAKRTEKMEHFNFNAALKIMKFVPLHLHHQLSIGHRGIKQAAASAMKAAEQWSTPAEPEIKKGDSTRLYSAEVILEDTKISRSEMLPVRGGKVGPSVAGFPQLRLLRIAPYWTRHTAQGHVSQQPSQLYSKSSPLTRLPPSPEEVGAPSSPRPESSLPPEELKANPTSPCSLNQSVPSVVRS